MKRFPKLILPVFAIIASSANHALDCSQATVDQTDSPRYFQLIRECADLQATRTEADAPLVDETATVGAPDQEEIAPTASPASTKANKSTRVSGKPELPMVRRARQVYPLDRRSDISGPADTNTELFRKMAGQCPGGWEKRGEWVEVEREAYIVNIEFSCLETR